MRVHYDDSDARLALREQGIEVPPLGAYFDRLMDFALTADWGRRPLARHETGLAAAPARRAPRRRGAHPRPLPSGHGRGARLARRGA
jgi:hypothetical protein